MEKHHIVINEVPAVLWGQRSERLFLYIHGKGGNKEEAAAFSEIVCPKGFQVLSIDLPEHGQRKPETGTFDPWHAVPELKMIMEYAHKHWQSISLFANSIGAWFSMLSFSSEPLEQCLFLSPVVDFITALGKKKRVSTSWEPFLFALSTFKGLPPLFSCPHCGIPFDPFVHFSGYILRRKIQRN